MELATAFRESPMTAQRLCRLLGTSRMLGDILRHNPDLLDDLGAPDGVALRTADELLAGALQAMEWREDSAHQWHSLKRYTDREGLRIGARDVLDGVEPREVGVALTNLADAALEAALAAIEPQLPVAIIALGRLGGEELSYASDLDVLVVYDANTTEDFAAAERVAVQLLRSVGGNVPHIYDIDLDLRPEGKDGPLARSLDGFRTYFDRWAQPWERLAMARARFAAGDRDVADRFLDVLAPFVWEQPVSIDERREIRRIKARVERERIPAGEDPQFHLKLGPGSLSDVEFCAQLLQLEHGVRCTNTIAALDQLRDDGHVGEEDHRILTESYRFCERTRNRWFLVNSSPSDSLPARDSGLEKLATSLDTTAHQLREDYRRVTRRCRRVVERLFYGRGA
jgi:glutamate-ammonia-ligase adenylyltransferase